MVTNQQELMYVGMFCGGIGAWETSFTRAARERQVLEKYRILAINHNLKAINLHRRNHPEAEHLCEDINQVNPRRLTRGKRVDIIGASPACTHFSNALGDVPREEQQRVGPFRVVDWMYETSPRAVVCENVPEIKAWGALDEDGKPIKELKGTTFHAWIEAMRSLGYDVQYRDICAADYGVPTSRLRTFIIARKDRPVYWPEPTHAQNGAGGLKPWRPASEVIDQEDLGISIFDRKKPLVEKTLRRIRIGLNRFVGIAVRQDMRGYLGLDVLEEFCEDELETSFLCKYFKSGTAVSLRDPLDTITTHDRFGLVNIILDGSAIADVRYRILKPEELARAMNFDGLQLTGHKKEDVFYIGNSVAGGVTDAIMRTFLN